MLKIFETNLAKRLIKTKALSPPIDIFKLSREYAHVEVDYIPLDVDAVCFNLKISGVMPTIVVNRARNKKRQRFTVAHELGHVLIPWHRGVIVDDTTDEKEMPFEYREMEFEANRFASELLMPDDWVKKLADEFSSPADVVDRISVEADVSIQAAIIRSFGFLRPGIVFAQLDERNQVINSFRSEGTFANALHLRSTIDPKRIFPFASGSWVRKIGRGGFYHWWEMPTSIDVSGIADDDWRVILHEMLRDIGLESGEAKKAYASISATSAAANGIIRGDKNVGSTYSAILQRFVSKARTEEIYDLLMKHPKIRRYIANRARSLIT
ncbi:MAG: hypothetical protein DI532_11505 [Azospirillum brasilense]|nr:MAG: hypothetical protein DI532_11505 [Azospirillum brasilense]